MNKSLLICLLLLAGCTHRGGWSEIPPGTQIPQRRCIDGAGHQKVVYGEHRCEELNRRRK